MSSLPFISHHLFVAAVRHESHDRAIPPQGQPDPEAAGPEATASHLGAEEWVVSAAADEMKESFLVSGT